MFRAGPASFVIHVVGLCDPRVRRKWRLHVATPKCLEVLLQAQRRDKDEDDDDDDDEEW